MRSDEALPVHLVDYRPPGWLVHTVELDISLAVHATHVRATLALRPNGPCAASVPLVLDGKGLTLRALKLEGSDLASEEFVVTSDRLAILQPPHRPFQLEIETVIDPSANVQFLGLYRSGAIYCTQCEPEGFRRITYFPDRPDVMAIYTTRIEAEKADAPVLLANGNLVEAGDLPGTSRHFAVWHDPFKKPSYLFALVGGRLACVEECFRTRSGRDVKLRIYVESGKEPRAAYAMDALKRSMKWDEEVFGREYDLDIFMIVAVSDFNRGAMENKGLNVFNDKYVLADPETATDADYANIEAIIAHEYFHNWTGNRITCRDWFQLCLKEGLTVYRDQEFSADMRSSAVVRIGDVLALRAAQFVEDAGPLAHSVRPDLYYDINNLYTATVYAKGAEIVRMIKVLLGPEKFLAGMDFYFERHDGEAVTVEQFVQCFADVSDLPIDQFMLWYSQAGTPNVVAAGRFDAASRSYYLELSQSVPDTTDQPEKKPLAIPLAVGLLDGDGQDLPLTLSEGARLERSVLTLTKPIETFVFHGIEAAPVPSLNRGFSAPVNFTADLSPAELRFLAAHDSDPFNRWQALQTLATTLLIDNTAMMRAGAAPREDTGLLDALRAVLNDGSLEPAFIALALTLPAEADIARNLGRDVDPDAIFAARAALRKEVGIALAASLLDRYDKLTRIGLCRPYATGVGQRALRNVCLDLLVATGQRESVALAEAQYRAANNMTDRMAALTALSLCDVPERAEVLENFYTRYAEVPLVIDKWFALQAAIPEPATFDRVRTLTNHPAFSFANSNRVRALIHTFAAVNQKEFNRADGASYDFLVHTVRALDPTNPQLAALLLSSFTGWHMFEPRRGALAQAALRRVLSESLLSPSVADIARRALFPTRNRPSSSTSSAS